MKKQNNEITIKDFLSVLLPKAWLILLVGILTAGAVGAHSIFVKKDYYTCSSRLLVQKQTESDTITSDIEVAEQMVAIFKIAIYDADRMLDEIAAKYQEYGLTAAGIRSMMSIQQYEETPFLKISVTHTNPDVAYNIAQEIANQSRDIPQDLEVTGLTVTVYDDPAKPVAPNSKNTMRNAIIAFLAGAIATMAVIWIISIFDSTIRGRKKIEDNFDIPVLATIPLHLIPSKKNEEEKK